MQGLEIALPGLELQALVFQSVGGVPVQAFE
jgi:hypothetical protein